MSITCSFRILHFSVASWRDGEFFVPRCLLLSIRCEEGDQLRAVARVRGAAGVLTAAREPRLLLPPGAQRAGSNAWILF